MTQNSENPNWLFGATLNVFLVRFGLVLLISFLFTLAGPFGTFRTGLFLERFGYWFVLNGVSLSIALGVKSVSMNFFNPRTVIERECLIVLITTLLFTPFLWYWTTMMFPGLADDPPSILWMGGGVLLICASISAILCNVPLVIKFENPTIRTKQGQARIVKRLPENFDGKIVRLSVDGHIVRVVTDAGIFDLRMRFTDAIEEVLELDGVCTHRSHWVVLT